jgi:hypothetical protein
MSEKIKPKRKLNMENSNPTDFMSTYFSVLVMHYEWLRKESYDSRESMSSLVRQAIDLLIAKRAKNTQ